jgi:hypothetical protein
LAPLGGGLKKYLYAVLWLLLPFNALGNEDYEQIIWSENRLSLAFCDQKVRSTCFVICENQLTDVSIVERGNLGKLGSLNKYEKIVTYPYRWESDVNGECRFWFKTHAWLNGQRYTVGEPVYVKDGYYEHR